MGAKFAPSSGGNDTRVSIFQQLENARVADWIDRLGLERVRGDKRIRCPSCQKPDAMVGTREGREWWWQCQHGSCGAEGGVVKLAEAALGLSGRALAEELERLAGVETLPRVVHRGEGMPADYPGRVWREALKHESRAVEWLRKARGIEVVDAQVGGIVEEDGLCGRRGDLLDMLPVIALPLWDIVQNRVANVHLRACKSITKPRHMDIGWGEGVLMGAEGLPLIYGRVKPGSRGMIVTEGAIDTATVGGLVAGIDDLSVVGVHSAQAMAVLLPALIQRIHASKPEFWVGLWPHGDRVKVRKKEDDAALMSSAGLNASRICMKAAGYLTNVQVIPALEWHDGNDANDFAVSVGWQAARIRLLEWLETGK